MDDKMVYSYIDEIGKRLADPGLYGAASLMVGAGFSKNADCIGDKKNTPPDWTQLSETMYELKRNRAKKMFEVIIEKEGLELLGWRKVPTEPEILGHKALECMPYIMQAFVKRPEEVEKGLDFDRKTSEGIRLYL